MRHAGIHTYLLKVQPGTIWSWALRDGPLRYMFRIMSLLGPRDCVIHSVGCVVHSVGCVVYSVGSQGWPIAVSVQDNVPAGPEIVLYVHSVVTTISR